VFITIFTSLGILIALLVVSYVLYKYYKDGMDYLSQRISGYSAAKAEGKAEQSMLGSDIKEYSVQNYV